MNLGFKLKPEELKEQVEGYATLPLGKSYRGISFLLLMLSIGITIVLIFLGIVEGVNAEAWVDVVLLAALSVFVYRGQKWAFIAAILLWTFEKIYLTALNPTGVVVQVIWWYIYVQTFYKAYLVEKARKIWSPVMAETTVPAATIPPIEPPKS